MSKYDIQGSGGFLSGIPNITPDTFTVTDKETGEKSEVVAWDKSQAAEKAADGEGKSKD